MIALPWERSLPSHSDHDARSVRRLFRAVAERSRRRRLGIGARAALTAVLAGALAASWVQAWVWNSNLWLDNQARLPGGYVRDCGSAQALGVAPLYKGFAGYREALDGDGDGVACEPGLWP